jgi:hypothetical protein
MSKPIPKGKVVEGDMTDALDSRFLNSIVLQGALAKRGTDHLVVEIDRVEFHEVLKYENGQTAQAAYLLYFKGSDKPLKLAKTNVKRLLTLLGTVGAGWAGKKIALCVEMDKRPDLGGTKGPCVRVKMIDPTTGKAPQAW